VVWGLSDQRLHPLTAEPHGTFLGGHGFLGSPTLASQNLLTQTLKGFSFIFMFFESFLKITFNFLAMPGIDSCHTRRALKMLYSFAKVLCKPKL
jgi:hypothetical protein